MKMTKKLLSCLLSVLMLLSSVVVATAEAADTTQSDDSWKMLYNFEDGAVTGLPNSDVAKIVEGEEKAADGTHAYFFQNTATAAWKDNDLWIPTNSNVSKATGISFWVYNLGAAQRVKFAVYDGSSIIAYQNFTVPSKQYVKCFIDFKNLGSGGDKYGGNATSGTSLSAEQISSITHIIFQPLKNSADSHPGFYIDSVRYEVDSEPITKNITFDNVTFDCEYGKVENGKLVFTPPAEGSLTSDATIALPEKLLEKAESLTFNVSNTTSNGLQLGARFIVGNEYGEDIFWKWGENPDFASIGANAENVSFTRSFNGGNGGAEVIHKDKGGWSLGNWWNPGNNPPTAADKASFNTLTFRVINLTGTEGTFTLNSITVNYPRNTLSTDSAVKNGSIIFDRSSAVAGNPTGVTLVPEEGYLYVPDTFKVVDSADKELDFTADTSLNSSIGARFTFAMPDSNATVYAQFVKPEDYDEALAAAQEAWKPIYDFEDGETASIATYGGEISIADGKEFAANGSKALFFRNPATAQWQDKDLHIPLNRHIAKATGISFWVYNMGDSAQEVKSIMVSSGTHTAQKIFTIPAKQYVKCFVDFNNLGTTSNDTYGARNNSGYTLTKEQIAAITELDFYPLKNSTEAHPGFYIDNIRYELEPEHEFVKTVPFDKVNVSGATSEVVDGKLVLTPTESATTAAVSINVPERFFAGASTISYSFNNTVASAFDTRIAIKGTNDNGVASYWKWGENITAQLNANTTTSDSRSFEGGGGGWTHFFECDSYHVDVNSAWSGSNNPPSSSEKASATSLEIRIFNFAGEGTVTIDPITINYAGNKIYADSAIENGTVKIDRTNVFEGDTAGFTLAPAEGFDYVPGTLKVMSSDGTEIDVGERYGFRSGNIGYHYEFKMPAGDAIVYAEFAAENAVSIVASADEAGNSLRFDFNVATTADGKAIIDGTEREIASVGAIITTDEALTKYGLDWSEATRELVASDNAAAAYADDINIGANGTGLKYDEAHEFIRYNAIIKNLSSSSQKANFLARAYIEYKDDNGDTAIAYYDDTVYCWSEMIYGSYYAEKASFAKGISYSGVFEVTTPVIDRSNKIFNQETFNDIAAQGFDSVRLPVNFTAHTDDTTADYRLSESFMAQLDTAVKNAINAGLTIIIDFHQTCTLDGTSLYSDYAKVSPKYLKIWEQVAARYKNYPDLVAFELINEPEVGNGFSVSQLNTLQEQALNIIRANNLTRKVFVAGGKNNEPYTLTNISSKLKNDGNTVAAVHCYYPMEFTHQGAEWLNLPSGVNFDDSCKTQIDKAITACASFARSSGMQVWMGEFGVYNGATAANAQAYITYFRERCEANNVDWCYWEYNQGFGAYSESAGAWKDHVLKGLGLK